VLWAVQSSNGGPQDCPVTLLPSSRGGRFVTQKSLSRFWCPVPGVVPFFFFAPPPTKFSWIFFRGGLSLKTQRGGGGAWVASVYFLPLFLPSPASWAVLPQPPLPPNAPQPGPGVHLGQIECSFRLFYTHVFSGLGVGGPGPQDSLFY